MWTAGWGALVPHANWPPLPRLPKVPAQDSTNSGPNRIQVLPARSEASNLIIEITNIRYGCGSGEARGWVGRTQRGHWMWLRAGAQRLPIKGRPGLGVGVGTEPCPPGADPGPGLRGPRSSRNPRRSHPAPMLQTDKSRRTVEVTLDARLPAIRSHRDAGPPGCLERPGSDEAEGRGPAEGGAPVHPAAAAPRRQVSGAGLGSAGALWSLSPSRPAALPGAAPRLGPSPSASRPTGTGPSCPPRAIPAAPPGAWRRPLPTRGLCLQRTPATAPESPSLPARKPPAP